MHIHAYDAFLEETAARGGVQDAFGFAVTKPGWLALVINTDSGAGSVLAVVAALFLGELERCHDFSWLVIFSPFSQKDGPWNARGCSIVQTQNHCLDLTADSNTSSARPGAPSLSHWEASRMAA